MKINNSFVEHLQNVFAHELLGYFSKMHQTKRSYLKKKFQGCIYKNIKKFYIKLAPRKKTLSQYANFVDFVKVIIFRGMLIS